MLTIKEMEMKTNNAKRKTFEFANKPGKWIAKNYEKEKKRK